MFLPQLRPEASSIWEDGRLYELVVESTVPVLCPGETAPPAGRRCTLTLELGTSSEGEEEAEQRVQSEPVTHCLCSPVASCGRQRRSTGGRCVSVLLPGGPASGSLRGRRLQQSPHPLQPRHRLHQRWEPDDSDLCCSHPLTEFPVERILARTC